MNNNSEKVIECLIFPSNIKRPNTPKKKENKKQEEKANPDDSTDSNPLDKGVLEKK